MSFWFAVTMLVVRKERWALWLKLLNGAQVQYTEGTGVVRALAQPDPGATSTRLLEHLQNEHRVLQLID